jgi:cold shock CspA family protein
MLAAIQPAPSRERITGVIPQCKLTAASTRVNCGGFAKGWWRDMKFRSGIHSDSTRMSDQTHAARLVAKLLAARHTPLDEVPHLIENVQRALSTLGSAEPSAAATAPLVQRRPHHAKAKSRPPKRAPLASAVPVPPIEVAPRPAATTLVRRTAIAAAPATAAPPVFSLPTSNAVRGVVQWFDSRGGDGMLRLPGLSRDLPVDAATLARFGISRLFKGQEIDATLAGPADAPKLTALHLANAPAVAPIVVGTVRDRHAKTVVVELKREAPRRSAARAEAELVLPPRSVR